MKHAKEIIELMASFPGREFRMIELVRYVCPKPKDQRERSAVHRSVHRAIEALVETGSVVKRTPKMNGGYGTYYWK